MANVNPNQQSSETQKAKILAYMLEGNTITPLEALNRFKCFRLGARIADLKDDGYEIQSKFVSTPSEKKVKQYWINTTKTAEL